MKNICIKCGQHVDKFANGKRCRACYNTYMNEYMRKRYHDRRRKLSDLLDNQCIDCGSENDLELDHADASVKSFDIVKRLSAAPWKKILEEFDKCVARCSECHSRKGVLMGDDNAVEHGGGVSGKKNCYCDLCAPVKKLYNREWKARKRASQALK